MRGLQVLVEMITGRQGAGGSLRQDHETSALFFGELIYVVPGTGEWCDAAAADCDDEGHCNEGGRFNGGRDDDP